jgi:hypothetical protein
LQSFIAAAINSVQPAARRNLVKHLPKNRPKNVDHLVIFFVPPPPFVGFVANKGRTAIRPSGDRAVEALFSRFFGLESRSIFSAAPIAEFTLWLIGKRALDRRELMTDLLVFKDQMFPAAWAAGLRFCAKCNT